MIKLLLFTNILQSKWTHVMRLRRCALGFGLWLRADPHRDRVCVITRPIHLQGHDASRFSGSPAVAQQQSPWELMPASAQDGARVRGRSIQTCQLPLTLPARALRNCACAAARRLVVLVEARGGTCAQPHTQRRRIFYFLVLFNKDFYI